MKQKRYNQRDKGCQQLMDKRLFGGNRLNIHKGFRHQTNMLMLREKIIHFY